MRLLNKISYWLSGRKRVRAKTSDSRDVFEMISKFRPRDLGIDLIRIGSNNDGGYLIPNNFDGVKACFSPGVSDNSTFEQELSNRFGIKSFLADPTLGPVASTVVGQTFDFEKKFIGGYNSIDRIDLGTWIANKNFDRTDDYSLILQMDIEGFEYEVFNAADHLLLSKFRYLVIEFHEIEDWNERNHFNLIRPGLNKIFESFVPIHFHPNNHNQFGWIHGKYFPKCFESTLVNKDFLGECGSSYSSRPVRIFPHPLDQPNNPKKPDIFVNWDDFCE